MKTILVILLWIGSPPDWKEFKLPMRDAAECREVALAYFHTPEKEKPQGVLLWCETFRAETNAELCGTAETRNR